MPWLNMYVVEIVVSGIFLIVFIRSYILAKLETVFIVLMCSYFFKVHLFLFYHVLFFLVVVRPRDQQQVAKKFSTGPSSRAAIGIRIQSLSLVSHWGFGLPGPSFGVTKLQLATPV